MHIQRQKMNTGQIPFVPFKLMHIIGFIVIVFVVIILYFLVIFRKPFYRIFK